VITGLGGSAGMAALLLLSGMLVAAMG